MPTLRELYQAGDSTSVTENAQKVWTVLLRWTPERLVPPAQLVYSKDRIKILGTFSTLESAKASVEYFVSGPLAKLKEKQVRTTDKNGYVHRENKLEEHEDGTMEWTVFAPGGYCQTKIEILEQRVLHRLWQEGYSPIVVVSDRDPVDCDCSYDGSEHVKSEVYEHIEERNKEFERRAKLPTHFQNYMAPADA